MRLEDARSRFVPGSHQPIRFDPPAGPAYLQDPAFLDALQAVVEVAEDVRHRLRHDDRFDVTPPVPIEELTKRLGFARGEIVALPPSCPPYLRPAGRSFPSRPPFPSTGDPCPVCGLTLHDSPSGSVCDNGHGGFC